MKSINITEMIKDCHNISSLAMKFQSVLHSDVKTEDQWNEKIKRLKEIIDESNNLLKKYGNNPVKVKIKKPFLHKDDTDEVEILLGEGDEIYE